MRPQRPGVKSKSRSPSGKKGRQAFQTRRPSASPGGRASPGRSKSPRNAKAALIKEMNGISTPLNVSPSPKRKAGRSPTPPSKRTKFIAEPDEQPFRPPTPLTPLGWDVSAAQDAGVTHPSAKATAVKPEMNIDDPNNPHAAFRRALDKARRRGKGKGKGKGKKGQKPLPQGQVEPQPKEEQKGRGRGRGRNGQKGGKGLRTRFVQLTPSKGKGRGRGKKR